MRVKSKEEEKIIKEFYADAKKDINKNPLLKFIALTIIITAIFLVLISILLSSYYGLQTSMERIIPTKYVDFISVTISIIIMIIVGLSLRKTYLFRKSKNGINEEEK